MTNTAKQLFSARPDISLAVVRVALGVVFVAHGAQKLFSYGIAGVAEGFAGMGIPLAFVAAPLVSILEFVGGIALIVGYFSRPIAAMLVVNMLVATLLVHLPNGFFVSAGGIEFSLILAAGALAIAIGGPGALKLSRSRGTA